LNDLILDNNDNVEKCTVAGTSASVQPTTPPGWNTTTGGTTTSGTATFTNQGASPNGSLAVPATAGAADATVSFSGSTPAPTADTLSSPYPDYNTDTIYVGANDGKLHKFTPVFNAAPAEITATWPVTVTASSALTSP